MAETVGGDLIVRVLEEVRELRGEVKDVRSEVRNLRMDMERRFAIQSDTMMLIASTVQQLTVTLKGRVEDHEERLVRLEAKSG